MAAEIHIIGQIESAYGFGDNRVACRWSLHCGWPRILVEVWNYDKYGRHSISGYGNCFVPSSPGEHKVECHCWRPKGDFKEELTRSFIGGGLQLRSANILLDPVQSAQLRTVAAGTVEMRLGIITRHLDKFGILC
uniref:B9 domain-containing protein 2 n=1 Tax=Meloidogyne javanica TaxID=6303 RepID=A0A915LFJ2_MELJA